MLLAAVDAGHSSTRRSLIDNLNRVTLKDLPSPESDVSYSYDLLDRNTGVSQGGYNLIFGYDALSRQTSDGQGWGTISRSFDLAGKLTRTTWQDGFYVDYDRLVTGEMTKARENGATSGVGVLATYGYDNLGNRTSVTYGNGAAQAFTYDAVGRLASLTNDLSGTTNDLSVTFAYNPASQIIQTVRTGDAYAWTGHGNGSTSFTQNGLNQQVSIGGSTATWDAKGNLTSEPQSGKTYSYWTENRLKTASGGVSLYYDPIGRLSEYDTSVSSRFMSDGAEVAVEVDNPGSNIVRRFVRGDGPDELIAWYEGSGTATRRFAGLDERNSVISATDSSGTLVGINAYDEYGKPGASNIGRFGYTGQLWLPEANATYSKARNYLPHLGIFAQTDPIGYAGGANLYAYTVNDPVNFVDPLGLCPGGGGYAWGNLYSPDLGVSCPHPGGLGVGGGGGEGTGGAIGNHIIQDWEPPGSGGGGGSDPTQPPAAPTPEKKCPAHPVLSALGKINNALNTFIGLGAAAGSAAIGRALGYNTTVGTGNNAIQVQNAWTVGGRAYTIGNVQVYSPGNGPEARGPSYTGAIVQNGPHEEGHTIQSQILGPLYLPVEAFGSLFGNKNALEVGADKYAAGQSCTGF